MMAKEYELTSVMYDRLRGQGIELRLTTKWKAILAILVVGIAVLSSVCYSQSRNLD